MSVSAELITEIAILRQKAREGTMTIDDTRRGIQILRGERLAMDPPKTSRAKAPAISADSLFDELDKL